MNKPKHSWIQSPCTLTPAGGTWKEQCINIQYLVPTSAWVTHKGNRDPMELHNNRVSRRSNKKKWKMYAKLLQVRYALFKEVQICKVILKVTFLLSNEQRKMTKKNIKGRKKSAVNLKLQNVSMFFNRQFWWEKTFYAVSFLMLLLVLVRVSQSLRSFSENFYSPISYSFTSPAPHASLHILPLLHPLTILPIPKTTILTKKKKKTRQWHTLFILVYHVRSSHYYTSIVFLLSISSNNHNHFPISLNFHSFFKVHW